MGRDKDKSPAADDAGFTFIEVLVVILIVGILAAIALPMFTQRGRSGFDAAAKSQATSLSHQLEACRAEGEDFRGCEDSMEIRRSGLNLGSGRGHVEVVSSDVSTYVVEAHSESGNNFRIRRLPGGRLGRDCDTAGDAGCRDDSGW